MAASLIGHWLIKGRFVRWNQVVAQVNQNEAHLRMLDEQGDEDHGKAMEQYSEGGHQGPKGLDHCVAS